jgi:hypothetical protein
MYHDDDCGVFLNKDGLCPTCDFHPDMQSCGFKEMEVVELTERVKKGQTFLGQYRVPIIRESGDEDEDSMDPEAA